MNLPEVIYENDDFIVVDKPAGITMHYADGEHAIIPLLESQGFNDLKLVHRLDEDTSGLLILAKHQNAANGLARLFSQRRVSKFYIALSSEKPNKKQGHILGDMKKSRNGNYQLARSIENPAYTQFTSSFTFEYESTSYRLFLLKPHTGKTHQLRVALKSIGAPIHGDKRYSKQTADRMYLHAFALQFSLNDESYEFIRTPSSGLLFENRDFIRNYEVMQSPFEIKWPTAKKLPNSSVVTL